MTTNEDPQYAHETPALSHVAAMMADLAAEIDQLRRDKIALRSALMLARNEIHNPGAALAKHLDWRNVIDNALAEHGK